MDISFDQSIMLINYFRVDNSGRYVNKMYQIFVNKIAQSITFRNLKIIYNSMMINPT